MKLAVVEWWPRICGATDWGIHLSAGAEGAGVEVERLTFSKSGRRLKVWGAASEPWAVYPARDAVEVLRGFDGVVLTDVVTRNPDWTKKGAGLPYYVDVLETADVPWTTMLHDGAYEAKLQPTIDAMLASRAFAGTLITTREREIRARFPDLAARLAVHPFLPYDVARAGRAPKRRRNAVLMTARLTSNKGQDIALRLFRELRGDLEIAGWNSFGLPSYAWLLWELGQALGYEEVEPPILRADKADLTHPNAPRFYTGAWRFGLRGRRAVYLDAYAAPGAVDWSPKIHVSLANDTLRGTLEYATLDAIFSGCLAAVPEHAVEYCDGAYGSAIIQLPFRRGSVARRKDGTVREKVEGDLAAVAMILNNALAASSSSVAAEAAKQLDVAERLHDPATPLRILADAVGNARRNTSARKPRRRSSDVSKEATTVARKSTRRGAKPAALGGYIFAGGFTLGVEKHFDVQAHFEQGDYGVATARKLWPKLPIHVDPDSWPWEEYRDRVAFLYGNPPCAAWSPLGPRAQRGLDAWRTDPRVDCTRAFFNLFELVRPTVWAWESVPQAFTTGRNLVDHLTERATRRGYNVDYVLHNARYLGALQSRKRFFMVASVVDVDWECPWLDAPGGAEALASYAGHPADDGFAADRYYPREFLRMVPPGSSLRGTYDAFLERVLARYRKKHGTEMPEALRKKAAPRPSFGERRVPVAVPPGAIVDSMNVHPTEARYLTLGEMMHLGGYPVDRMLPVLAGAQVDQKARQLTRAVLPPVGAWLAGNVRRAVDRGNATPHRRVRVVDFTKPPGEIRVLREE